MRKLTIPVLAMLIAACSPQAPATYNSTDSIPAIFPDYTDVTIPANIAPLNFLIEEQADAFVTVLSSGSVETVIKGNKVCIPESKWKKLTSTPEITVRIYSRSVCFKIYYNECSYLFPTRKFVRQSRQLRFGNRRRNGKCARSEGRIGTCDQK